MEIIQIKQCVCNWHEHKNTLPFPRSTETKAHADMHETMIKIVDFYVEVSWLGGR
jgi:hypothetical protein